MSKSVKTNALRLLDKAKIKYEIKKIALPNILPKTRCFVRYSTSLRNGIRTDIAAIPIQYTLGTLRSAAINIALEMPTERQICHLVREEER